MNDWITKDAFEVLPKLDDKSVDLIITDPPYDLNSDKKMFLHKQFLRISRGAVIVFSPPENQWIPAQQYLFWIKPISTKNTSKRYSRFVEMIFVYNWDKTWNVGRHWSQYTNVFMDLVDDSKKHPYRKPPSLIERLILNHTNPGDFVLDPFAGSGVVPEVCDRLGRGWCAIEIDWSRKCPISLE